MTRLGRWVFGRVRVPAFCVDCKAPLAPGSLSWRDRNYTKESGRRVCAACMEKRRRARTS